MTLLTFFTLGLAGSMLLVSGVLLAFSDFALRGLSQLPAVQAVAAMQAINRTVLRSIFLVLFMVNAIASMLVAIIFTVQFGLTSSYLAMLAALLYVVGVFFVTGLRNVPLNETLRTASPANEAAAKQMWQAYVHPWKRWNNVRVAAGIIAAFCLLFTTLK